MLAHPEIGTQSAAHHALQLDTLSLQDDVQANCPICEQLGGNASLKPNALSWLPSFANADSADIFYERYPVYPVRTDDSRAPPFSSAQS